MINVNNSNKMSHHEQVIQLSNHVKNKFKKHQYAPISSPLINSSDEYIEVNTTDGNSK